jgi:hypothetical protein
MDMTSGWFSNGFAVAKNTKVECPESHRRWNRAHEFKCLGFGFRFVAQNTDAEQTIPIEILISVRAADGTVVSGCGNFDLQSNKEKKRETTPNYPLSTKAERVLGRARLRIPGKPRPRPKTGDGAQRAVK